MTDEVRELYKAYFKKLRMRQSHDTIIVYWEREEIPGYSMYIKKVNHKTSFAIKKYSGTITFASSTSIGRDLW